jgi:hypothetical protein
MDIFNLGLLCAAILHKESYLKDDCILPIDDDECSVMFNKQEEATTRPSGDFEKSPAFFFFRKSKISQPNFFQVGQSWAPISIKILLKFLKISFLGSPFSPET